MVCTQGAERAHEAIRRRPTEGAGETGRSPARADAEEGGARAHPPPGPSPRPKLAGARGTRTHESLRAPRRRPRRPRPRRGAQRPPRAGAATGSSLTPGPGAVTSVPRLCRAQAPGSCSLGRRAEDGAVWREGAKGDAPAASSAPSPVRLREPAPSCGAGRRAERGSSSARTQRQGAA